MSSFAELRQAAAALESERVIDALARTLDALRAPDSAWCSRLAQRHALYSPEVIERGLALGLADWSRGRLEALYAREVREPCWRPELVAVWLAGSIPTASFAALIPPLLAGSAVYAKPASSDAASPALLAEALCATDPEVGRALALGDDVGALASADACIVYGSDDSVARLRAHVPASSVFVGYGHKLSVALVGPGADPAEAAERLSLDVALWDGRGCLSPAWVGVIDASEGRAEAFASALADALERRQKELPRGTLTAAEQSALHDLRARDALREHTRVWQSRASTDWSVALQTGAADPLAAGSLRRVPLLALPDVDSAVAWCRRLAPHLSCVGHAGFGADERALARSLAKSGASRLCPLGRMQRPPIEWHHDGQGPIRPLLRLLDVEGAEEIE